MMSFFLPDIGIKITVKKIMINKQLKWTTSLTCMAKITIVSKPASWF